MKIRAERWSGAPSVQEMVQKNAKVRLNKLIQIGLNHDTAHGKVRDEDKLEEKKARKRAERKQLIKLKKKLKKELMKSKKRQTHVENKEKRKKRAAKAKRLAKAKAKAAKEAEEKTKLAAIAATVDAASQTSEVITSSDVGSKDTSPAAQPIAIAGFVTDPTLFLPSTTVPTPNPTRPFQKMRTTMMILTSTRTSRTSHQALLKKKSKP